jgi:hypothetical protein
MLLLLYSSASSLVMAVGALPLLSLPALHAPPPAAPIFSFLCLCSPPAQSRQATGRNCDQTARDDTRRLSRHAPVQLEASSSGVVADSPRTWIIAGKHLTSTQSSEIKTSKKHSHQTGNFGRSVAAHSLAESFVSLLSAWASPSPWLAIRTRSIDSARLPLSEAERRRRRRPA